MDGTIDPQEKMNSKVGVWSILKPYGNHRSVLGIDSFREPVVY